MIVNRQLDLLTTVSCQKLLERIPHLAWLMNDGGEIVAVNQQWCDYLGQGFPDRQHPWIFTEVLHAEERELFLRSWQEAISLQTALKLKIQLQSCQGNWEWFQVELDPDCDSPKEQLSQRLGQTTWIGTAIRLGGEAAVPGQQQSPQFLEALLANASDGIVACDADGHLVLFNLAAQIFHGLPPEPIEPDDWGEYYDLYDRDGIEILSKSEIPLFRALQGETVLSEEMMIKSSRGGVRSLLASGTAIYSTTGEKLGAVVLMRDITAYKQAETERLRIQLYNERLSIAMRVAKAGAWTWDLVTKQTFWTPEFEVLFDYEPGSTEQVYSEWLDRLHPDDRERVEAILHAAVEGKLPEYRCEYRIVLRNGQIRWIDVIGELHPNAEGKPKSMSGLVYDITDRKQAEIALQASEELFRKTFEHIPLGFAHVALDGTLLRVNQKFGEIVGRSPAELLATTFQAITEPADLAEDLTLLAQLVKGEIGEYTLEKRYIHKQGHHVWVNLTVALIRSIATDEQLGTPQYFLSAIKDITDRKQLELLNQTQTADLQRLNNSLTLVQQQLQERNVELDRFVSIAAHDLKAPLRAIANLSEWIEEDLKEQTPGENPQLQLLRQRVKRMDALIDGLLRYSRAGREELVTETVDIAQLLTETIDSLSPPASFEIKIVSTMPILLTKRLLLTQVFANLINNAIKHHQRIDGRIEITVEDLSDCHQFSIADDGPGIPTGADRDRIFEIFQTLHPTTDSTENTGIGLALVKKIVEGEGGKIWLDEEYKQGCRFCFTWLKTLTL
jgi:PAS domain S-box-containing protein